MSMTCPKCEQASLVGGDHGTSRCPACGGMFVPRSRMAELLAQGSSEIAAPKPTALDQEGARCPVDRSVMSRTVVQLTSTQFHLERCSACLGVWFDSGEWGALASSQLTEQIDELWSAEWRANQRREHDRTKYEERLEEAFGPELHQQLLAVASALRGPPPRSQAVAVIREESGP